MIISRSIFFCIFSSCNFASWGENACPLLCFSFFCSCSTLLPGAGTSCAHRQQTKTGTGLPSWDSHPSEDLSEPPSLRDPAFCGAVTGRKYHYRLPASWQAIRNGSPWDGHFSLCTFGSIFLPGFPLQVVMACPPLC